MVYIKRHLAKQLTKVIQRGKSVLLLGPRQTGKTTLIEHIATDETFPLADVRIRLRYEKNPGLLASEIEAIAESKRRKPLIAIDEVQKIPILMDVVQDLIDRKIAQFILTGSSARKLRKGEHINLLPGRVISLHMDPLLLDEVPKDQRPLKEWLSYGSLPEIVLTENGQDKQELLNSYVSTYLEEEIRAEALVRDVGHFARFLELASAESGYPVNLHKLSQEIGVARTTIANYYEILENCLVGEKIEPISDSKSRRKLAKANKYLIFDLGVRRVAAKEGTQVPVSYLGHLFEQFVGLELIRMTRNQPKRTAIHYWRDLDGPEIDWVIDIEGEYIPVEVKWTDAPTLRDARHLQTFLKEYKQAKTGYIISRTPRTMKLADRLFALSWRNIPDLLQ